MDRLGFAAEYTPRIVLTGQTGGVYMVAALRAPPTASLESRVTFGTVRRTHGRCSSRGTPGLFPHPASAPVIDERGRSAGAERHRGHRERRIGRHPARRHR